MNRISVILSILILSTLCFYSCKSSKSSVEGESTAIPDVTLQEMAQSYTDWNTYSTSGKLTLSGAASFSTSIQVKMTHNKSISISIRPVLGIEVAKVFVDNDSAVVIDKLHRVYTTIELERFKHILPVNIGNIQDIMLARPFTINDGDRICQMVIARHETAQFIEVETLSTTERGEGGFGHTGKK